MLRREPRARRFFATLTQSALGTGAGYVALLLIAYERLESPWAISLVLVAELLPAMVLGPICGAAADRWSRRTCCIAADLVSAVAFVGIALAPGFEATLALALLAGVGTALFRPAALAALPSLVDRDRLPAGTALFGAIADLGFTAGPALAAPMLLVFDAETVILVNGLTFAISAAVLATIEFGAVAVATEAGTGSRPSLFSQALDGLRVARTLPLVRVVLVASGAALLFAGLFNVAELPFVTGELGAGESAFSLLVALFGIGFLAGSLLGSSGGELVQLRRRYLLGLFLMALALLGVGASQAVASAAVAFTAAGFGNGVMLVHERLLIQHAVSEAMQGRIYGIKDAFTAWAFAGAFLSAGALIAAVGARPMIIAAGASALVAWALTAFALRRVSSASVDDRIGALPTARTARSDGYTAAPTR